MRPTDFDPEHIAALPPHELVTYAKDQPEYWPLPVARIHGRDGRLISRWTLTPEERTRIAAGEDLFLEVLTFNQALQPQRPTVGLEDYCPVDRAARDTGLGPMRPAITPFMSVAAPADAVKFPRGRLNGDDEGAIEFRVGVQQDVVVLAFPTPTAWVGLPAEQAEQLADILRTRAAEARRNRQ